MFYSVIRFIVNIYVSVCYNVEVEGKENVPKDGSAIICANHIHWGDPVLIICKATDRKIYFLGKIELFKNRLFSWFLKKVNVIPVRRGQNDISAIKNSLRVLKDRKVLGIFPEGTRVTEGKVVKPESGLALLAIKSKTPIIPMGISGSYKLGSKLKLTIGKPIVLEEHYDKRVKKEELEKITHEVMEVVKKLVSQ